MWVAELPPTPLARVGMSVRRSAPSTNAMFLIQQYMRIGARKLPVVAKICRVGKRSGLLDSNQPLRIFVPPHLIWKRCTHYHRMSSMPDISPHPTLPMIDIGANLTDGMYQGCYHGGTMAHPPDLDRVLHRAWSAGVQKIIVTGTSLEESRLALALARTHPRLYATVGVHPTRCGEFEAHPEGSEDYLAQLRSLAMEGKACGKVVAIGECGLDNDRLHFCDAETQEKWFAVHFSLAQETGLPMFLHLRNAIEPFIRIFEAHKHLCGRGVVHSFDGSQEDAHRLLQGSPELCIGLNGCSLKTAANVQVASVLPLDRLLLETDAPWCEIRPSHASHSLVASQWPARDKKRHDPDCTVKGRNEPCKLLQVLEAVAGARGEEASVVAQAAHANTVRLFFPDDAS